MISLQKIQLSFLPWDMWSSGNQKRLDSKNNLLISDFERQIQVSGHSTATNFFTTTKEWESRFMSKTRLTTSRFHTYRKTCRDVTITIQKILQSTRNQLD